MFGGGLKPRPHRGWVIGLIVAGLALAAGPSDAEMQAAGVAWLGLVDQQKYAESWNQASSVFRTQVSEPKWEETVKAAREPLGAVGSRKFLRVTASPDGLYRVLQFQTSFAEKTAVETLTFTLEDGKWKCAAFFIR
jgi:hypothetical protein